MFCYFNSHTREGVTPCYNAPPGDRHFNSHTREGVTHQKLSRCWYRQFQLTHPWGCDEEAEATNNGGKDFNSHTREGVTKFLLRDACLVRISTHTPVRVWLSSCLKTAGSEISTHTPVRVWPTDISFRSATEISTHTPVRVWHIRCRHILLRTAFQLTHPWGCDVVGHGKSYVSQFQLTHPWGCDRLCGVYAMFKSNFNSHTREGVTRIQPYENYAGNFNSHTREGVTIFLAAISDAFRDDFNSHTREGVTSVLRWYECRKRFQLTHPWGCDTAKLW